MILTERIITVNGNISTLDAPIYLYQGDKNVDIYFSIVNPKYKFSKKVVDNLLGETAAYFDLYIIKPDGSQVSFKNQAIEDKKAKWTIESELIDEEIEIGKYDFQIRLLDENKTSILTIPPLLGQLEILKPIYTDSDTPSNNLVNLAATNYALATSGNNDVVVFDEDGNYVATVWTDKMKITDTLLNKIETAIKQNTAQYKDIANKIENGNIGNNIEPQLMDMPRIYFSEGTLPTSKTATVMKFDYYSKTNEYHGYVDIKCQGTSSMSYPKKNFTIKLYTDKAKTKKLKVDFKGWGKQSKFVLKANWIDISHARNVVSARLWGDIIKTRGDYATALPELLRTSPNQGAIDGFPVLVYSNGIYQGRYTLNIPKDKWMSNMDDTLDTHCILCGENYVSGCFRALPNINGTDWTDELHDVVPATIKTSWSNAINFVMNSTDDEFKANLGNYFDVNSLIDYLLYGIVCTNLDGFGKNQIYFTYDGVHWIASVYDLDSTWGLWWNGSKFVATDYAREDFQDLKDEGNGVTKQGNLLYLRLQQLFIPQLKTRYAELRKDVLSVSHIIQKFEEFNDICPKDIVQEDYASTTGGGNFTGIPSKTTNNIQQLRSYINARLTYVDGYINALYEAIPCTNITLNNATLSFTTTDTQTLTATLTPTNTTDKVVWSVSPTGFVTVNNGDVTPIKNGECVITATCGSHSATCNVTVSLPAAACTSIALDKTALQLGTIESSTPDTETNLLEGLSWKDGQLNDNAGIMGTGTDKCIANIPIPATGLYTLSCSVKYTYPKIFLYNNDNQLIRSNIGNNNNNSLSIYVYEPNCHISISLFPNSLEFSENNVTLKYTHNMADTPNKDTDIQASAIANFNLLITSGDYKIIELYADKVYTDIAALKLGSTTYKLYNWNVVSDKNLGANANDAAISITRMNNGYCTKGEWAGKTFFNIAVPSTWGDTKEDIINYIQTNNIAVIMNPSEYLNSADKIGSTTINSYQLKPTIQPNNCTDIVEWSTSPEGIVTANNGLVKAVRNGEAVVTATCGTKSATCNVTVSGVTTEQNLLEGVTWSAKPDNGITKTGQEKGSGKGDAYLSGQIPCDKKKYVLSNINGATFLYKEMYVYASDGTYLGGCTGDGKYNSTNKANITPDPVTMDLRNINETPAYMKITVFPNNVASNNSPATQLKLVAEN